MDAVCPNCGEQLVDFRTDRQSTGGREVILSWTVCSSCRHVALKKWMVAHPEKTSSQRPAGQTTNDVRRTRSS